MKKTSNRNMTTAAAATALFLAAFVIFAPERQANAGDFGFSLNIGRSYLGFGYSDSSPTYVAAPTPAPSPSGMIVRGQPAAPPAPAPFVSHAPRGPQGPAYRPHPAPPIMRGQPGPAPRPGAHFGPAPFRGGYGYGGYGHGGPGGPRW